MPSGIAILGGSHLRLAHPPPSANS